MVDFINGIFSKPIVFWNCLDYLFILFLFVLIVGIVVLIYFIIVSIKIHYYNKLLKQARQCKDYNYSREFGYNKYTCKELSDIIKKGDLTNVKD